MPIEKPDEFTSICRVSVLVLDVPLRFQISSVEIK